MESLDIDGKIKNISFELKNVNQIDAFLTIDPEKNIISEFYQNYLTGIDLSSFKDKLEILEKSEKQILLTEKGMIFVYKKSDFKFIILAGFRESTDIYNLQAKLDTILTKS